jgi:hypothetical protein
MFQMMGVFAEFERAMIQERVRAGLAGAKSEGKQLGRPRIAPELEARIKKALAIPGRPGVRKIAEQFGVDPSTVQRISRPFVGRSGGRSCRYSPRNGRCWSGAWPAPGTAGCWAEITPAIGRSLPCASTAVSTTGAEIHTCFDTAAPRTC